MNKDIVNGYNLLHDLINERAPESVLSSRLRDVLTDFCNYHCMYPKRMHVKDSVTNEDRFIYVPCGKCKHCRDVRQNEWVSRMILQTLYGSKYCYFVTLTYRSFARYDNIPSVLRDAYWRKDSDNTYKRELFSPCLCRLEHLQRFMKYLRKFHGEDKIMFFAGAEYGSSFGRPHFHLILWSDEPISKDQVAHAWSFRQPKSKNVVSIGRIDYNDLNLNGTVVRTDGKSFGVGASENTLHRCFRYVSKYVAKNFTAINDIFNNTSRLDFFIRDLHSTQWSDQFCVDRLNVVFNDRIKRLSSLYRDWALNFANYVRNKDFNELKKRYSQSLSLYNHETFKLFFDSYSSPYSYQIHRDDLVEDQEELQKVLRSWLCGISPLLLRQVFKPFCVCSHGQGIGSKYLLDHIEDFKRLKFTLPTYDGKKIMLPYFFIRKVKEQLYRFVQVPSSSIGNLSSAYKLCNENRLSMFLGVTETQCFGKDRNSKVLETYDLVSVSNIDEILKSNYAFTDFRDHTRCIAVIDLDDRLYIQKYKYDRSKRVYNYVDFIDFDNFVNSTIQSYNSYLKFSEHFNTISQDNLKFLDMFFADVDAFCNSIFGTSLLPNLIDVHDDLLKSVSYSKDYRRELFKHKNIQL